MRILQVIHQFPPYSSQGSEIYCLNLSRELGRTDDVRVFHVSNARRSWRRLRREAAEGIDTYHCIDRGEYSRVADWPNPFLRRSFEAVLAEFRPEVVHFHNFLSLGDDLVSRARSAGAAVVYTLHDYGLVCPNALLLRDDGALCGKRDPSFFQDCCPVLIRVAQSPVRARLIAGVPSLARWRLYARQQPSPLLGAAIDAITRLATSMLNGSSGRAQSRKKTFFLDHTRRIFEDADLFIAPSRFLLERYASCGLPRTKIVYSDYGMSLFAAPVRGPRSGPVRFGYIGALHPQKGVEVALEALRELRGARLEIFGSVFGSPISRSYARRVLRDPNVEIVFRGPYENQRVRELLAGIDALIVPSLWYENSPLTIHEAFIAGVPVVASGIGGMAELVRDGVDGLQFRVGDAADLREKLRRLIDEPDLLERLRQGIRRPKSIETDVAELRERYASILAARPSALRAL